MGTDKIYIIVSKTSHNRGKICRVVGKCGKYLKVQLRDNTCIKLSKDSIVRASKFDIIRSITDNELRSLIYGNKISNYFFRKVLSKYLSDFEFLE